MNDVDILNNECKELQCAIGKLIINKKKEIDLTLRDICGILDMTKHFFLMEKWEENKNE